MIVLLQGQLLSFKWLLWKCVKLDILVTIPRARLLAWVNLPNTKRFSFAYISIFRIAKQNVA